MAKHEDYLKQIYGGQPPSMDYYYQLGVQKRTNEEARKAAERARRKAESEAEKARKKAEKEAEKKQKEEEENAALLALLDDVSGRKDSAAPGSAATTTPPTDSKPKKKGILGGLFEDLKAAGKATASVLNPFGDNFMDIGSVGEEMMKRERSEGAEEASRLANRAVDSATFGVMGSLDKKMMDGRDPYYTQARKFGDGGGSDIVADLLGSLVPGAGIAAGLRGTRLGANLTDDMTKLQRAGQRAKEGAAAGAIYGTADAGLTEALDPNRRDMPEHMRNIALETLFGGVADPALGGIFDALGKGTMRTTANAPNRVRDLVSNIQNPEVPNVMAPQMPNLPEPNLGPSYRNIPAVTQPEFEINRTGFPLEPQARQQDLEQLLPQRDNLLGELENRRNAFMDDFLNRYQAKVPNNEREVADALSNWDFHKTQAQQYKEIRKNVGRFTIPEHLSEDYRGLFPRSFIAKSGTPNVPDVFAAAEGLGFPGNDEGVRQLGNLLTEMQQSTTVRKMDIVPEAKGILSDKDKEGIRGIADAAFPETDDAKAINPLLDALEQDISALQDTNAAKSFKVDVKAPEPRDPFADIAALRPAQQQAAATADVPSRKPQTSEGDAASPIARHEETHLFQSLKDLPKKLKNLKDRAKYELVSEYQPLKDIERQIAKMDVDNQLKRTKRGDIEVSDSFYKSLRNAGRASRVSAESIQKGYIPILEDLNKAGIKREAFEEYALARHAKDILDKNAAKAQEARKLVEELQTTAIDSPRAKEIEAELETLDRYFLPKEATPEWVEATLKKYEGNEAMDKAQQKFVNEQRKDIIMLERTGRYSKAQAEAMLKEHPNYVSLRREIDEISDVKMRGTGSTTARVGEPFKKRGQGSLDKVLPPIESAMQNRIRAIDTVMKNDALKKVEKLLQVDGAETFFKPLKETDPYFKDINKLTFYKDGKARHYEVPDDIARMLSNMGQQGADNAVFNAVEKMAVLSKKGMTHYNPSFLVKSPVRDTINALFTTRTGMNPIDITAGFMDALMGKQLSKLTGGRFKSYNDVFKDMGGDFSSYISMDVNDLARVQKTVQKGNVGKGMEVLNPFKHLETFGAAMERGPRLAEFRAAKRKGYSEEGAVFESTDVIDYSDLGNSIKKLNRMAPYLGATLRGNIRVMQAFKEKPLQAVGQGITYITLPTLGIYSLRFHESTTDAQRAKIQNMPDWQKNLFWAVPDLSEGSDKIYMIPKGFLVTQIFANPVERALDQLYGPEQKTSEKIKKETIEDFKTALMPPSALAAITTIGEISRNHNDFLGIPIESEDMQKKPAEERYDSYTSELAKVAGKMMGLSPAKMDYFIKQTTGGLGRDVLDLSDNLAREAGVERAAHTRTNAEILNPFSQFGYDDTGSSRYANELYEASKKEADTKREVRTDFKERTGLTMPSDDRGLSPVGEYNELFRDINSEIKEIREDTTLSSAQKKQMIADLRDEQRNLGVRLTEEGALSTQEQQREEMVNYLQDLGQDAKPTKGDVGDVLREQLLARGHSRQNVERVLKQLDKKQMVYLLEQMR